MQKWNADAVEAIDRQIDDLNRSKAEIIDQDQRTFWGCGTSDEQQAAMNRLEKILSDVVDEAIREAVLSDDSIAALVGWSSSESVTNRRREIKMQLQSGR